MTIPTIVPSTAAFTWVDPTTNEDGSPLVAGEVIGYNIGIRADGSPPAVYPITASVAGANAAKEAVAAIGTVLKPGTYWAAIQSVGPTLSAWSPEVEFAIAQPVPNPPTGFTVA
jgi:hypothetical protein